MVQGHTLPVEMGRTQPWEKSNLVSSTEIKRLYIIHPGNPTSGTLFHGNESPVT